MANELKWYFGPGGSEDQGPKDSIELLFKGNKYYSIAREAIQNSLDAIADDTKPVSVKFSLFEMQKSELPNFFKLKDTMEKCKDYYKDDSYAQKILGNSISAIDNNTIKCLRISDYNTIGLEYNTGKSPFYAFMQAVGVNLKRSSGSGGSFGFGKGAYYAASAFKTIIVSSVYSKDKFIFQGKSRLTSHMDGTIKKDYVGKFGVGDGEPVQSNVLVPEKLRRNEQGTDIIIMGFQEEGDWKESLIKSILNNFWMAIWSNHLVVDVEGSTINQDNLEKVIGQYYTEDTREGSVNEPESWNPYPYFKAVKYKGGPNNDFFYDTLPTLGYVELYLFKKDGLQNRTTYMRRPRMAVYKETKNLGVEYVAVFICKDKGNDILKEMENPQHNEWKKNNYLDNDKPHIDAIEAEKELKQFINKSLQKLLTADMGSRQKIAGLDKFMNLPEDLLPENDGDGNATGGGNVTNEKSDSETAVETTFAAQEPTITIEVKKKTKITEIKEGEVNDDTDEQAFSGTHGENEGPVDPSDEPGVNSGSNPSTGTNEGDTKIKTPLSVRYRVIAQKNAQSEIEHLVKIFCNKNTTAELELYAGVDNESETEDGLLSISHASKSGAALSTLGNKIKGIALVNGENILTVKFDSNQKHSLKIKSYEV